MRFLTKEIVGFIPIVVKWGDGDESKAHYALTKTWLGRRSWFLCGSIFPCDDDDHPRFRHVENWLRNGIIASCAIPAK